MDKVFLTATANDLQKRHTEQVAMIKWLDAFRADYRIKFPPPEFPTRENPPHNATNTVKSQVGMRNKQAQEKFTMDHAAWSAELDTEMAQFCTDNNIVIDDAYHSAYGYYTYDDKVEYEVIPVFEIK